MDKGTEPPGARHAGISQPAMGERSETQGVFEGPGGQKTWPAYMERRP